MTECFIGVNERLVLFSWLIAPSNADFDVQANQRLTWRLGLCYLVDKTEF